MKKPGTGTALNNDGDWFDFKVKLRAKSIEHLHFVRVLECFAGEGKLWSAVEQLTGKRVYSFKIDANFYDGIDLQGDSKKIIEVLSLSRYHVIDLDSWGSPICLIESILKKHYKGIIHATYCSPIGFSFDGLLATEYYNVPLSVIKKSPGLFAKPTGQMISSYLAKRGISKYYGHLSDKKNYFYFNIT